MCAEMCVYYRRFDWSEDDEQELLLENRPQKIMVIKTVSKNDSKQDLRRATYQQTRRASAPSVEHPKSHHNSKEIVHLTLLRHQNQQQGTNGNHIIPDVTTPCRKLDDRLIYNNGPSASMFDAGTYQANLGRLQQRSPDDVDSSISTNGRQHHHHHHHHRQNHQHLHHDRDSYTLRHQVLKRPLFAMDPVDRRLWDPCPCKEGMKARLQRISSEKNEELYPICIPEYMGPGGRDDGPVVVLCNPVDVVDSGQSTEQPYPVKRQRSVSLPKRLLDFPIHLHLSRKSSASSTASHQSDSSDQYSLNPGIGQPSGSSSPRRQRRGSSGNKEDGRRRHKSKNKTRPPTPPAIIATSSDHDHPALADSNNHPHRHHGAFHRALAAIDTNLRRLSLHSSIEHWRQNRSRHGSTQSVASPSNSKNSSPVIDRKHMSGTYFDGSSESLDSVTEVDRRYRRTPPSPLLSSRLRKSPARGVFSSPERPSYSKHELMVPRSPRITRIVERNSRRRSQSVSGVL